MEVSTQRLCLLFFVSGVSCERSEIESLKTQLQELKDELGKMLCIVVTSRDIFTDH